MAFIAQRVDRFIQQIKPLVGQRHARALKTQRAGKRQPEAACTAGDEDAAATHGERRTGWIHDG